MVIFFNPVQNMNIILKTSGGHVIVRPDTTWEKDNDDLYLPDFVQSLSYTPILFVRMSRPGRSIQKEFASRYYDSFGYGMLFYPDDLDDGTPEGFAAASCLDKTSLLPFPLYNMVVLGNEGNVFQLEKAGQPLFSCDASQESAIRSTADVDALIEEVTGRVSVRTGDMVAIELAPRMNIFRREEGNLQIRGTYCENEILNFQIIVD